MITAVIRLMRLYYTVPIAAGLPVIITYVTAGNLAPVRMDVLLATLSLGFVIAGTYVLNDVCDVQTDSINRPARVFVGRAVSRRIALVWTVVLFLFGLIAAAFCNGQFLAIMIGVCLLAVFYNVFSKRIGLLKAVVVALLMTSLYPLAFAVASPVDSPRLNSLLIFPAWLFLSAVAYEMLKDIRDAEGDAAVSARSIARHTRSAYYLPAARCVALGAGALCVVPGLLGYCGGIYLAVSLLAAGLMIASTLNPPGRAIPLIYIHVFLITFGSLADLLVLGP